MNKSNLTTKDVTAVAYNIANESGFMVVVKAPPRAADFPVCESALAICAMFLGKPLNINRLPIFIFS